MSGTRWKHYKRYTFQNESFVPVCRVTDVLKSLEQGLLDYRKYIDEQEKDMDASDKRGVDDLITLIKKVIAYAKTLL